MHNTEYSLHRRRGKTLAKTLASKEFEETLRHLRRAFVSEEMGTERKEGYAYENCRFSLPGDR